MSLTILCPASEIGNAPMSAMSQWFGVRRTGVVPIVAWVGIGITSGAGWGAMYLFGPGALLDYVQGGLCSFRRLCRGVQSWLLR